MSVNRDAVLVRGARERMLFLAEFEESPHAYAMPIAVRLVSGHLNASVFAAAFRDVAAHHVSLRTAFSKTVNGWTEDVRDAAEVPVLDRSQQSWDGTIPVAPDPARDAPSAAVLYSGHVVIVIHHVAADGQSVQTVLDDLEHAYSKRLSGHAPDWSAGSTPYVDPPQESAGGLADAFADMPAVTPLPMDRPRQASPSSHAGVSAQRLPAWTAQAVAAASGRLGASRLMLLHAAVSLALRAHGAGDHIPVGIAADLRDETESGVGLFLNIIVGLADLSGTSTVGDVLSRVRACALDASERRHVPFDELVTEVAPPRTPGVHPLFQVMIAEVDRRTRRLQLGDVTAEMHHDAEPTAKFDLTFAIGDDDEGLVIDVVYRTEIFDAETAAGLLESVTLALVALTGNISSVADALILTRSSRSRPALHAHSDVFSSRRITTPHHHLAAALVGTYVSSDTLGTRRDHDQYVPLDLDDILNAAEVTSDKRLPDTTTGQPLTAVTIGDDVLLMASSEVVDDESWPALLASLSDDIHPKTNESAEYADALTRRAADLAIIGSAESWLDVVETNTTPAREAPAPAPMTDSTAHVEISTVPATVTQLRGVVLAALAGHSSGPTVLMVSEPDRDEFAHASAVGNRRRAFPVFFHGDGSIVQPNALAARDYLIAGTLSPHTPGVFDGLVLPDLVVDIHVSDRPVAHRPGHVAVTATIVGDCWRITVSGHPDAQAVASSIAQDQIPDGPPSLLSAIARPARAHAEDAARIGGAALRRIERATGPLRAVYPATPLQEGLLFHRELSGDSDVYVSQTITELTGTLDVAALRGAAARMIERHPHVAGHFRRVGERTVLAVPRSLSLEWDVHRGDDRETFIAEQRQKGLEPDGPLLRFGLLTASDENQHTWVLTIEHAILDGWSIWRLLRGILDEYTRHEAVNGTSFPPYSAYISWLAGQDLAAARTSWGNALDGIEGPTLVAEPERTGSNPDNRSIERTIALDAALTERLRQLGVAARTPLSAVYELAWALALRYETGVDDVVFGTVTSGRPPEIPGIDDLLGLLFNTVPVRVRIRPAGDVHTHLDELTRFRRVMLAHPYVPLSEILSETGHRELFDTLFVFQNIPVTPASERLGQDRGLSQRSQTVRDATHYPLTVVVNPGDGRSGARIRVMFRPGAWAGEDIAQQATERIVGAFQRALDSMDKHAGPLATLTVRAAHEEASGHVPGATIRAEDSHLLDSTVWELLVRRARLDPHGLAVVAGPIRWGFQDLVYRSTVLAAALQAEGIGPESRVALYLPRDERMIVALFAVFGAHAAYVPIDPTLPEERVAEILAEASPDVVVVDESLADNVPPAYRVVAPDAAAGLPLVEPTRHPDSLAYVIFTSGSTGKPKGVAVPYRGLTNMFVNHRAEIFEPVVAAAGGRRLAIAHTTSFAFDASWEQLLWLLEGHSVHIIDDDMRRDPRALLDYYDENRIDGFDVTPSYGQILVEEGLLSRERCTDPTAEGTGVVFVSLGGEAVPDELWSALRNAPGINAYNLYGPTEYTINALGADVTERTTSTVGRPITGTVAHVLDRSLQPVRAGVPGELYLSGVGLARGYLGRSDLTAERFVADPFGAPGDRMYRTGDLVMVGADGLLSYLGRSDDQVKIRGHRVEPAEVASAIAALHGVRRSAVVPIRSERGTELAAYVVPDTTNQPLKAPEIISALREKLPDYLVPSSVTLVDELPLNVNGKLDLRALPTPERETRATQQPIGDVEYLIAETIANVLGVSEVGRDDDFFMLGGHSLLAVRVVSRLRSSAGLDLNVRDLYGAPTVAGLARAATGDHSEAMFAPVLELRGADGPAVFCLQPAGGLGWAYAGLCRHLDPGYAVYALQDPALSGGPELDSIESIVSDQVKRIRAIRPTGPYHLLGWSFGGQLAHAIAAQLGQEVASVVLLDSYANATSDHPEVTIDPMVAAFAAQITTDPVLADLDEQTRARLKSTFDRHLRLSIPPTTGSIPGNALLVAATRGIDTHTATRRDTDWRARIDGELRVERVDLDHEGLGRAANWEIFGPAVARWIENA